MNRKKYDELLELLMVHFCERLTVNREKLYMRCRVERMVWCRWLIWYVMRGYFHLSLKECAEIYGNDHTTVINGLKKLGALLRDEPWVKEGYDDVIKFIDLKGIKPLKVSRGRPKIKQPAGQKPLSQAHLRRKLKMAQKFSV